MARLKDDSQEIFRLSDRRLGGNALVSIRKKGKKKEKGLGMIEKESEKVGEGNVYDFGCLKTRQGEMTTMNVR